MALDPRLRRGVLACYVRDGERVVETWRTSGRGVEVMGPTYGLLDRTVRQEQWEECCGVS